MALGVIGKVIGYRYCELPEVKEALNKFREDYPDFGRSSDILTFGMLSHCGSIEVIDRSIPICSICKKNRVAIDPNWNNWSGKEVKFKDHCTDKECREKSKVQRCKDTNIERYGTPWNSNRSEVVNKRLKSWKDTTFKARYQSFLDSPQIKPLFTLEELIAKCNGELMNQYTDKTLTFKWHCIKCGKDFEGKINQNFNDVFKLGYARCPICNPMGNESHREFELYDYIKSIYGGEVMRGSRAIVPQLELDIYIPDKKLAFEFDGIYWHSESKNDARCVGKDNNYHLFKTLKCLEHGIRLVHVFENEWKFKTDIVKSRIKNLLGLTPNVIYARQCVVKEVPVELSNEFQDANHIQGHVNAKINLGLFYNDKLLSLMTFSRPRFRRDVDWELIRFCNLIETVVVGGASKLFTYFIRTYDPNSIVSYADRRWSVGNLYEKLGFTLDSESPPNYWYWKGDIDLRSRMCYQKHKLKDILETFDPDLTEVENMYANGYNRIFDCGNLIYIWKKDNE